MKKGSEVFIAFDTAKRKHAVAIALAEMARFGLSAISTVHPGRLSE
jgi:hypothetical protein